jgi:ankyrin repeat protein
METSITRQETALHEACERANTRRVKYILALGAEVDIVNRRGHTPLYTACRRSESLPVVQILLEHGANISIGNRINKTPLHRAAHFGHSQLVEELLKHGVDVDSQDIHGRSALHYACDSSWDAKEDVIRLLLAAGADINILDSRGLTPLDEACEAAVEETIALLLANGALVRSMSYKQLQKCQHRSQAELLEMRKLLNHHRPHFMPSVGRVLELESR